MGGWGKTKTDPAEALVNAVRRWLTTKSTGDEEEVVRALVEYDRQTSRPLPSSQLKLYS